MNKCGKPDFLQIRHFFLAEKVKAGSNRGLTVPPKPLVKIGEPQCDFCHTKMAGQTNKPYFDP